MARKPDETKYRTSVQFQERVKTLIEEQDLNKNDFAKAAGVNKEIITRATVYGIIPSVKSLIKLADYLELPLSYLLGESDEKDFYPTKQPTTFYERLKELTEEEGIKYSTLSNTMTFAKNSIYEWIRTNSLPSLDYLKELASHFEVSIDYLLGRTDYKK